MNSGSCASDKDSVQVMLGPLAPDAGADKFICETEDSVQLDGGYGMNATDSKWMTTGSGSFGDKMDTNTAYGPSANDKSSGSLQLILHTSNEGICTMKDTLDLTIYPEPNAQVSKAPVHCIDNSPAQLDGNSNTGSGEWSTSGSGSFGDPTSLNTDYSFSGSDVSNGRVTVSLATTNNGTCQGDTSSKEIVLRPSVSTSPDIDTTVVADSVSIGGSVGNAATEWAWSTYGSGRFTDSNMVSTYYSPSQADKDLGSVNLLLTASNQGDCPSDDVLNLDFTDTYIEERNEKELSMKLHPVPASSELFVTIPQKGAASEAEFEIVDLTGRLLREGEIELGTRQRLQVEDLHKGSYLLRVRTDENEVIRKWSKR
jgi:hypothetical protein